MTRVLAAPAALAAAVFVLPLVGLVARAPWSRIGEVLTGDRAGAALALTLRTSLAALVVSVLLGVPLAWLLARGRFPGRAALRALVLLPMVLPPVVGGVGLLSAFGRRGLVGGPLDELLGWSLPFSTAGVVLAETFVAMPFLVVTVEAGLRALDPRVEEAAATLGARPLTVLRRVTVPRLAPSLAGGAALCWARAVGEFGATITFAGNLQGRTQTVPLAVYVLLESDAGAAALLSLALVGATLLVLAVARARPGSR